MVAARNRLRILMGQKPIGITNPPRLRIPLSTRTTPRPSTPTRMETTRQRIVQNLILDQEAREALNSTDLGSSQVKDPSNFFIPFRPFTTLSIR